MWFCTLYVTNSFIPNSSLYYAFVVRWCNKTAIVNLSQKYCQKGFHSAEVALQIHKFHKLNYGVSKLRLLSKDHVVFGESQSHASKMKGSLSTLKSSPDFITANKSESKCLTQCRMDIFWFSKKTWKINQLFDPKITRFKWRGFPEPHHKSLDMEKSIIWEPRNSKSTNDWISVRPEIVTGFPRTTSHSAFRFGS